MFFLAHLVIGLLIGKLTGQYWLSLFGALFPDIDHFVSYVRNGILSPKKFWKTITVPEDPYGDQRYLLHNLWVVGGLSVVSLLFGGVALAIGYISHILLDMLDASDYFILYPSKRFNIKGPIQYFSLQEMIFTIVITCVLYII